MNALKPWQTLTMLAVALLIVTGVAMVACDTRPAAWQEQQQDDDDDLDIDIDIKKTDPKKPSKKPAVRSTRR